MLDALSGPHVAELDKVVKRRGTALALDGLSLRFASGQVIALLGPNGAGKSTAVGVLTGRLAPDAGQARLSGGDPQVAANRTRLGVMLQEAGMPRALSVSEQIDLFRGYYPAPRRRDEIVALAGLQGLEKRRCTALSGGQQRRLQFALAIAGRPDLLVLDEPSTGMDVEARRALWATVRAEAGRGAAVLLTTHHLEEAEALADRVVVIDRGRVIADGSPQSFKAQAAAGSIRCRTRLPDTLLAALTGVVSVTQEGGRVALLSREPQATLRELLARDAEVDDLSVSGATLEDAFNRLVDTAAVRPATCAEEIAA